MAKIYEAITAQREAIERGEKQMLRQLVNDWMPAHRLLDKRIRDLTDLIQTKREEGELVSWSYVYALERYKIMMREAEAAVKSYNYAAKGLITGAEADAIDLGMNNARQIVDMAEPTNPMWTRINKRETRIMSGMLSEPSPLSDLLDESWPTMRQGLNDVLLAGISTGQGPNWIAQRMMDEANVPVKRALTIARTETVRAYRTANLETMRSSKAVKGYRRLCYKPTACFACLMLDGEYYEKASDFSDHPNGKCSAVPVTKHYDPINDEDWETGPNYFENLPEEEKRRLMGDKRFELYEYNHIDPKSMVYIKENPLWGGSPTVKTLNELGVTSGHPKNTNPIPPKPKAQSTLSDPFRNNLSGIDFRVCQDLSQAETMDQIIAALGGGDLTRGSCASVALAYAGRSNGIDVHDFRDGKSREWFSSKQNKRDMAAECGMTHKMIRDFSKTGWEKLKSADLEENVDYLVGYACHMAVIHKTGSSFEYLELQSSYRNGWNKLNASVLKSRFGATDSGRYDTLDIYDVRNCDMDKFKEILGYLNTEPGQERKGKGGTIK